MSFIEPEVVQLCAVKIERHRIQAHRPFWRILLKLLHEKSLDPALFDDMARFIASMRYQGKNINDVVEDILMFNGVDNVDFLFDTFGKSRWFVEEVMKIDPAIMGTTSAGSYWWTIFLGMCLNGPFMYLRENRSFMTRVLEKDRSAYELAYGDLRWDYDLSLIAYSGSQDMVERIFRTAHPTRRNLIYLLNKMSEHLDTQFNFSRVFLLSTISKSRKKAARALRRALSRDVETATYLKKKIAEYVGVPTGLELTRLRRAHDNLLNWRNRFAP